MKMFKNTVFVAFAVLVAGCSSTALISTKNSLPPVYKDVNATHEKKCDVSVSLFRLQNYTDTPRAGMRAANLVEGILLAKGYNVRSHVTNKLPTLKKARKIAQEDGSKYFMYGGVSEWRYKTGIDGEPAVSFQVTLYKTKSGKMVWSSTGSDSDWGNASIGSTAQDLLQEMMAD